jgi:hypothetical protein
MFAFVAKADMRWSLRNFAFWTRSEHQRERKYDDSLECLPSLSAARITGLALRFCIYQFDPSHHFSF